MPSAICWPICACALVFEMSCEPEPGELFWGSLSNKYEYRCSTSNIQLKKAEFNEVKEIFLYLICSV